MGLLDGLIDWLSGLLDERAWLGRWGEWVTELGTVAE